jgi:polyphosphate kinase
MMKKANYIQKEISWLSFNARVLQEAGKSTTPLLERLRFLGIYSNNMDEFFRVRVATLKRLAALGKKTREYLSDDPKNLLKEVHQIVLNQRILFDQTYADIKKELASNNVFQLNEENLSPKQGQIVMDYFQKTVRRYLFPIMIDDMEDFPDLKDDAIYLAVQLRRKDNSKNQFALIQIPSHVLSRFFVLPKKGKSYYLILLDDVIRYGLKDVFYIFDFDEINAFTIKITKDAELDISDDLSEGYIKKISRSLLKRKEGNPVRFTFDANIPSELLEMIITRLELKKEDAIIPGGRYHNFKDFMNFPAISHPEFYYPPANNIPHRDFKQRQSIFSLMRKKDILLHFPYHSFNYFIDLLREASIDPQVSKIKITLYRLGKNSAVINALINAIKNGKEVVTVMELQARFDEEANIYWSNRLREAGARVIYGAQDLKVHAKLCLITRKENKGQIRNYAFLGTGNFNEDTTHIFSDHLLMSSERKITYEVQKIFDFFDRNYNLGTFRYLILSPFHLRNKMVRFINNEINNAKKGQQAFIYLKLNNLVDEKIIMKLYEAAQAGVNLKLNIRGMFSLVPDQTHLKKNIEAFGIIDRFLEHSRMFIFCNGGDTLYFLSSADLMMRNLDRRIEVTFPVYDKNLQEELRFFFDIQSKDNSSARVLNSKLDNKIRNVHPAEKIRSQEAIYQYLLQANSIQ